MFRPLVVLFGDSITQQSYMAGGWGASVTEYYQRTADVQLRGYSGYNTRWVLPILPKVFPASTAAASYPTPALVTVMLGANDANLPAPLRSQPASASRQHVPLSEYVDNLGTIVDAIQKAGSGGARVLLITSPPCDAEGWHAHCVKTYGGMADDAEPNRSFETTAQYAAACISLGEKLGVATLDLHGQMVARDDWKTLLSDGLHPNPKGGEFIAKSVLGAIEAHFPDLRPSSFFDDDPTKLPLDFPDHKAVDADDWVQSVKAHEEKTKKAK